MSLDFPVEPPTSGQTPSTTTPHEILAVIGRRIRRVSFENFVLLVTIIGLARAGFSFVPEMWTASLSFASSKLPSASEIYLTSSLGPSIAFRMMGYPSVGVWILLWVSLILLGYALLVARVQRLGQWSRPILLVAVMSPAFAVSLHLIGIYDPLIILGSLLVVCSTRLSMIVMGASLAAMGNPEQALVSAVCLMLLGLMTRQWLIRRQGTAYSAIAAMGFLAIQLWQRASGVGESRLDLLFDFSGLTSESIRNFVQTAPLMAYSWLGPLWLVFIFAIIQLNRRERIAALICVLVIPAMVTILTVDGTRVFVLVSLASLVALLNYVYRTQWSRSQSSDWLLGGLFIMLLVFPSVVILMGGVTEPFIDLIRVINDGP